MHALESSPFGKSPEGQDVRLFTLGNSRGIVAKITNYGGILTELHTPDRDGKLADIVLGFSNLESYLKGHPYFGALIGRVANRTARGRFTLNGRDYSLAVNNGPNHLHGGLRGFDKRIWQAEPITRPNGQGLLLKYRSPDGEEGYPGTLDVSVIYTLTEDNELQIDYEARTDQPSPVNLTNHSYFNLAGEGAGDVFQHQVTLRADAFTPVDSTSIPTGEIRPVENSPMDFRLPKKIGRDFAQLTGDPGGYDHNFVLKKPKDAELNFAADVWHEPSGRTMRISTTEPGVQFYTGNYLDGALVGKSGRAYKKNCGFCLETQHFPDALHHPHFPSIIIEPGKTFRSTTVHQFGLR